MATKPQLASFHRRRLKRIAKELINMSDKWEDVDYWISERFSDASESIKLLERQVCELSKSKR
ncbi:hypothetical protein [Serratia marcescens]|uniref:hypothetical protein n=1 Tax=Serratia marcescens TaxID=615 RepID=UPI0013DB9A4F|nr:hypothetical protein [Serratia marcescens]